MPIFKKKVDKNFTVVHNTFIDDPEVDYDAKGLLLVMLRKPDTWKFSIKGLAAMTNKSGEHKVSSILKRLRETGYLKMTRERSENGNFTEMVYYYSDEPIFRTDDTPDDPNEGSQSEKADKPVNTHFEPKRQNRNMDKNTVDMQHSDENVQPHCGNPVVDNPDVGNSDVDKSDVNNRRHNKYCNNQILNNQILYDINQSIYQPKTENPQNGSSIDRLIEERKTYEEIIKENIGYDFLCDMYEKSPGKISGSKALLDNVVDIMLDGVCRTKPIKVGQEMFPAQTVKSRFLKLNDKHILHLFDRIENYGKPMSNVKGYLTTALYDVSTTMDIAIDSEIRADRSAALWKKEEEKKNHSYDLEEFENYALNYLLKGKENENDTENRDIQQ